MSSGHGSSRRQAYGRRMKDVRSRRNADLEIDLEGPERWRRGDAWEDEHPLPPASLQNDSTSTSLRPR